MPDLTNKEVECPFKPMYSYTIQDFIHRIRIMSAFLLYLRHPNICNEFATITAARKTFGFF